MNETRSLSQVSVGVVLGILLQPLSVLMVIAFIEVTARSSEERGWGIMGACLLYILYFGMAQVLTILPASLLLLTAGKRDIVRGLLYVGTFLAVTNVVLLVALYSVRHRPFLTQL